MEEKEKKGLTRRGFLTAAGIVAAGGVVTSGLISTVASEAEAKQPRNASGAKGISKFPGQYTTFATDVLIIGAGAAGVETAINVLNAGANVIIVDKRQYAHCGDSGLHYSGRMTSSNFGIDGDNTDVHFEDAVKTGGYIVNQELVENVVKAYAEEKVQLKSENYGNLHARNAKTGKPDFSKSLNKPRLWEGYKLYNQAYQALRLGAKVMDYCTVTSLLGNDKNEVVGATVVDYKTGEFYVIRSKAVVLATGGGASLWGPGSVGPANGGGACHLTGDGHAMAAKFGVEFRDMEFRSLNVGGVKLAGSTLSYTTVLALPERMIYDKNGKKILADIPKEQFTNRRIFYELEKAKVEKRLSPNDGYYARAAYFGSWVSAATAGDKNSDNKPQLARGFFSDHWQDFLRVWEQNGLDFSKAECMSFSTYDYGGIVSTEKGETGVGGLYAIGECSMHSGAGYLSLRMFSSAMAMGKRVGEAVAARAKQIPFSMFKPADVKKEYIRVMSLLDAKSARPVRVKNVKRRIQKAAWLGCGDWRSEKKCKAALAELEAVKKDLKYIELVDKNKICNTEWLEALALPNMIKYTEMATLAAMTRKESRGTHLRNEYTDTDNDNWLKNVYIKEVKGKLTVNARPVIATKVKLPGGKIPQGGGTLPE